MEPHALSGEFNVHRVLAQKLSVLREGADGVRHLLDVDLTPLCHVRRLVLLCESVKVGKHRVDGIRNVQVPELHPEGVCLVEENCLFLPLAACARGRLVCVPLALEGDHVVDHGLVRVLVEERREGVIAPVHDEQGGGRFPVWLEPRVPPSARLLLKVIKREAQLPRRLEGLAALLGPDHRALAQGDADRQEPGHNILLRPPPSPTRGREEVVQRVGQVQGVGEALRGKKLQVQLPHGAHARHQKGVMLQLRQEVVGEVRGEVDVRVCVLCL
mmetsp:Transcript_18721/g.47233  ORF Transcript_18721/g.47233 Transcript_18721/m.47233 type:complete len:272 (+) Transcript_18721:869-1684(+)